MVDIVCSYLGDFSYLQCLDLQGSDHVFSCMFDWISLPIDLCWWQHALIILLRGFVAAMTTFQSLWPWSFGKFGTFDDLDWYVLDQPTQQSEGLVRDPLLNIFIILVVFLESWEGEHLNFYYVPSQDFYPRWFPSKNQSSWGVTRAAWDLESFTCEQDSRGTSGITGAQDLG